MYRFLEGNPWKLSYQGRAGKTKTNEKEGEKLPFRWISVIFPLKFKAPMYKYSVWSVLFLWGDHMAITIGSIIAHWEQAVIDSNIEKAKSIRHELMKIMRQLEKEKC